MDAIDATSVLGPLQVPEIVRLSEEMEQVKIQHEDRYDELQVRNFSLHDELQRENTTNSTLV